MGLEIGLVLGALGLVAFAATVWIHEERFLLLPLSGTVILATLYFHTGPSWPLPRWLKRWKPDTRFLLVVAVAFLATGGIRYAYGYAGDLVIELDGPPAYTVLPSEGYIEIPGRVRNTGLLPIRLDPLFDFQPFDDQGVRHSTWECDWAFTSRYDSRAIEIPPGGTWSFILQVSYGDGLVTVSCVHAGAFDAGRLTLVVTLSSRPSETLLPYWGGSVSSLPVELVLGP